MEGDNLSQVPVCGNDVVNNNENSATEKIEISEINPSYFLTASDLCSIRGNMSKNKNKDEDIDLYKGPKMYYPSENACSDEIVEGIMDDQKKSLELQRVVKSRDCIKAEWDEELKVAIVPHLKGKTTQHMGVNLKGNCALSPQEALFLLEKGLIEIEHKNAPLSVEEAYTVMLKGKLSIEKYEVYSFLTLQGFIVVHHQSRIGPSYNQLMNLEKRKERKRKAADGVNDSPEVKRLTFSGVLASNSEANTDNAESSTLANDSVLNNLDPQNVQSGSQDAVNNDQNVTDSLQSNEKVNSEAPITVPELVDKMDSNDDIEKNPSSGPLEQENKNDIEAMSKNDTVASKLDHENSAKVASMLDHENSAKVTSTDTLNNEPEKRDKVFEELVIGNSTEDREIDVENSNDEDDTNEVLIEDDSKINKSDEINVDESSDYYENDNFMHTDTSISETFEDTNDNSLDIYSCSPGDHRSVMEDINSETDNMHSGMSKEFDDDVTLVEVKKTVKKPLAVIDLLSDDEEDGNNADNILGVKQQEKGNNLSVTTDEEQPDSDDEIQVIKVFPNKRNSSQVLSSSANSIKSEVCRKLKISLNSTNIKSSYRPQMKFPDLCKKDILCLPRPPPNLLPSRVQPAKEAYVINYKSSLPKQGRLWNSYKDLQEYQRDRRRERHANPMMSGMPSRDFRNTNDSFSNQMPHFNTPEDSRDFGFDRNSQNFPTQFNSLNPPLPVNHERNLTLLPTPNAFNSSSHTPFMNIHNLQNLSSCNPVAFVNEIQKTVYSVATSMISSMLGHLNQNNVPSRSSPSFSEPMMNFNSQFNNFNQQPSHFQTSIISRPVLLNPAVRNDFPPMRFPPNAPFPGDQYSVPSNSPFMAESMRPMQNFRPRPFPPHRGPLFPCTYRNVRKKRDWHDVKAAVVGTNTSDSGSDIEEVPINLNQFLWSNDIKPLVKPGSKLAISDVLKSLQITQRANLSDANCLIDRYMPSSSSLEISFDVYLPNSKYRRSSPSVPNCRIIVLRAADPIPRYSELVNLKKKWNDKASLQLAIVDHGDISFYSFNGVNVPEIIPFES